MEDVGIKGLNEVNNYPGFKSLHLKHVYRTGDDDIYLDFYKKVLSKAVNYDRAVGYFSSSILAANLKGLSSLISSNGKMRLIIGHPLERDEFEAIRNVINYPLELSQKYTNTLLDWIKQDKDVTTKRLDLLAILIASGRLEIKFAFRRAGMYHEKIGIVHDKNNDIVVFQGSANETPSGMFEHLNAESISVYKSWETELYDAYGVSYYEGFRKLWAGEQKNTYIVDINSEFYEKVADYVENSSLLQSFTLNDFSDFEEQILQYESQQANLTTKTTPYIPEYLNGHKFNIKEHQRAALNKWRANNYRGILKLATGSGKTITSIYGAVKVYETLKKQNRSLCLIIAVPYIELANQWVENLLDFGITSHKCFNNKSSWLPNIEDAVTAFNMGLKDFLCVVVVNRTLVSSNFQKIISNINQKSLMFVGDECHNHGSSNMRTLLPDADFRMGLSATPFRSDDDEIESMFPNTSKENLLNYYGEVVAEYGLGDAINDEILTPYDYHLVPVYLNAEEQEKFEDLSEKITSIITKSGGNLKKEDKDKLTIYCGQRSRLLGSASDKLHKLDSLVAQIPSGQRKLTLFYAGEGKPFQHDDNDDEEDFKVIDHVSKVLFKNGWKTSQFTSSINNVERKKLMDAFKDEAIDALVAMKVLDEGIDVPACQTAVILSSTRNPRQYVQRRGRVLRKFPKKSKAIIYDFIVLPNSDFSQPASKKLISAEMERIGDFLLLADNKLEVENQLENLGLYYDI
ncbi:DEAD/DEAH box helicase family protein [Alteromonas oceani]|uniref:DEAD/DEAH box helicase family protein n=1 Tax=Alteromonas oceani TaxID=2071609 RepID=A0ABV7JWI4_9ALTE|nr:DEAD/DEAH box helicase family protein [Alteromonas oceani]